MYRIILFLPQIIRTDSEEHSGLDTDQPLLSKLRQPRTNQMNAVKFNNRVKNETTIITRKKKEPLHTALNNKSLDCLFFPHLAHPCLVFLTLSLYFWSRQMVKKCAWRHFFKASWSRQQRDQMIWRRLNGSQTTKKHFLNCLVASQRISQKRH